MNNVLATLVGVVITLLLIVTAITLADNAMQASKVRAAAEEVETIAGNIRSLFNGNNAYPTFNTCALSNFNVQTPEMGAGCAWTDPWGGGAYAYSVTATSFEVAMYAVPGPACLELGQLGLGGMLGIKVNGTYSASPISESWLMNVCAASNSMIFTFE